MLVIFYIQFYFNFIIFSFFSRLYYQHAISTHHWRCIHMPVRVSGTGWCISIKNIASHNISLCLRKALADLGGVPSACPLRVQILSFGRTKFSKRNCLGSRWPPYEVDASPLPWEILDQPLESTKRRPFQNTTHRWWGNNILSAKEAIPANNLKSTFGSSSSCTKSQTSWTCSDVMVLTSTPARAFSKS